MRAVWRESVMGLVFGILGGMLGAWGSVYLDLVQVAPKVVTFDVTKFVNAERAIASNLLTKHGAAAENATVVLARVSKMVQSVVREEAGPGTLVLIRQGVVARNVPDITDKVLRKLGLPTKVVTQSPERYADEIAPTDYSQGLGLQTENTDINSALQKNQQYLQKNQKAQNLEALP